MSGQKIIDGLQEAIDGKFGRITEVFVSHPSPGADRSEAKKPLWGWVPQAHNGLQYMRRGKERLGPFDSYGEAKAAVRKLELS